MNVVTTHPKPTSSKPARIERNDILAAVRPFDLWVYYTEPVRGGKAFRQGMKISNPFLAEKQATPSFTFWNNEKAEWRYRDFATGDHGDIFDLVQRMYGLSYPQALERIATDFCIQPGTIGMAGKAIQRPSRPADLPVPVPTNPDNFSSAPQPQPEEKPFNLVSRPFTSAELSWWAAYGIKPELLEAYGVKALQEATGTASSGKSFHIRSTPASPVYAYVQDGWAKLYRPMEKDLRFVFLGNKPKGFVFGMEQLPPKAEFVILTGGEKDVLSLSQWNIPAICLNSETATLEDALLAELRRRFEHIIVMYDNDETGLAQSELLCRKHGLKRVVLPAIPNGGKDISDYLKAKCDMMAVLRLIEEAMQGDVGPASCVLRPASEQPEVGPASSVLRPAFEQPFDSPAFTKDAERRTLDISPTQDAGRKTMDGPSPIRHFTDLAELGRNLPELRHVFGNYILEGNTVLFPSERGVGKTYFMLQLALSVAAGASEFCGEPLDLVGNTLYINFELGERVLMRRLAKLYETHPLPQDHPYGAYCLTFQNSLTEHMQEIETHLLNVKPVLVILDNLRAAFSDRDNERNREMTQTLMELNALRERHRFALVLVHHTKKGHGFRRTDSDMQSGAGALTDLADADFFLRNSRQDTNLRILRRMKSRECEAQDRAKLLRLNTETLWFEMVEDNVNEEEHIFQDNRKAKEDQKALVLDLHSQGFSIRQIVARTQVSKSSVERWLKDAKQ